MYRAGNRHNSCHAPKTLISTFFTNLNTRARPKYVDPKDRCKDDGPITANLTKRTPLLIGEIAATMDTRSRKAQKLMSELKCQTPEKNSDDV